MDIMIHWPVILAVTSQPKALIYRQVMVLLRALVYDRLIQNNWSEIQNIGTVQFIINEHVCTETQTSAFNLTFDDLDSIYMQLPADSDLNTSGDDYVKILKDNLQSRSLRRRRTWLSKPCLTLVVQQETICPSLSSTPMLTYSRITLYPVQPSEYYPASGHRG
jgi:hypothetical protein